MKTIINYFKNITQKKFILHMVLFFVTVVIATLTHPLLYITCIPSAIVLIIVLLADYKSMEKFVFYMCVCAFLLITMVDYFELSPYLYSLLIVIGLLIYNKVRNNK